MSAALPSHIIILGKLLINETTIINYAGEVYQPVVIINTTENIKILASISGYSMGNDFPDYCASKRAVYNENGGWV
jgi:hypothetical protein